MTGWLLSVYGEGVKLGRRRTVAIVGLVIVVGVVGFVLGRTSAPSVQWHETKAEIVGEADHPLVNFEYEGRTWAIEGNLAFWIDEAGQVREAGWPICLLPNPSGSRIQKARRVPIRFAAVTNDQLPAGHKVMAVDCRPIG